MSTETKKKRLSFYAGCREALAKYGTQGAFNFARVYGCESVELLYIAHECGDLLAVADEYRAAIKESGVKVSCISCFADIVTKEAPYEVDAASVEAVKRCIDLSSEVGSPLVHHTIVTRLSGTNGCTDAVLPVALTAARDIADYARERGITVLYEPQGVLFNGLRGYSKFFDAMLQESENVGMCLDVGNTLWVDEDCYAVAEKYSAHVKHVHLKDYVLGSDDKTYRTLGNTTIKEVALGEGVIDLERVFAILDGIGYDGFYSIEDNSRTDFLATYENAERVINS